ncbi:MAG TPA: zinc ribbon domain-containing protein [Gemmatimonadaceae bacterium]|nr:zinc ribbon domain-containing protein [Gemmatimonadaceae bacterium]
MDQLDRLYRTLVQTIRTSFPQYLTQPFEVAELYQTILPYRHHRRTLGFETNQDYEVALLELLSGERGYLLVDERMRDALRREIATPNPDPAVFRQFAGSQVSLAHEPLRHVEAEIEAEAGTSADRATGAMPVESASPRTSAGDTLATTSGMPRASAGVAAPRPSAGVGVARPGTPRSTSTVEGTMGASGERAVVAAQNEDCRFCGGRLPAGRHLTYCPHCGQNLTVQHCLACGTELELGWKFCISCGRSVSAT